MTDGKDDDGWAGLVRKHVTRELVLLAVIAALTVALILAHSGRCAH